MILVEGRISWKHSDSKDFSKKVHYVKPSERYEDDSEISSYSN